MSLPKRRPFRLARGSHGLAMVEIIIAIGVLAVVSMFVVEMFVRAANLENKARDLDHAAAQVQTAIEGYRGLDAQADTPAALYVFDAEWNPAFTDDVQGFTMTVTSAVEWVQPSGENAAPYAMRTVEATVYKNAPYLLEETSGTAIYTLESVMPAPGAEVQP